MPERFLSVLNINHLKFWYCLGFRASDLEFSAAGVLARTVLIEVSEGLQVLAKAFTFPPMNLPLAFAMGFAVASLPGPILVLITTETLRKGPTAGVITMTAPLIVDALVMLPLAWLLQASLVTGKGVIGLGLVGACLLVWLGFQSMRVDTGVLNPGSDYATSGSWRQKELPSFLKGVLTHLTNPYPYIYWATIGVIFIRQGFEKNGISGALLFPIGFWLGAGTLNFLVVCLVARGRRMLPPRLEPYLHRFSGVLLMGTGVFVALRTWWTFF